ncbi:MAG: hypothetical protein ACFFD8_04700 [Candidatus Thorarchaeota archaeon]
MAKSFLSHRSEFLIVLIISLWLLVFPPLQTQALQTPNSPFTTGDTAIWENLNGIQVPPFRTNTLRLIIISAFNQTLSIQTGFWSNTGTWALQNTTIPNNATTILWSTGMPLIGELVTDFLYLTNPIITDIQNTTDSLTGQHAYLITAQSSTAHWLITYDASSNLTLQFVATIFSCCSTINQHYILYNTTVNLDDPVAPPQPPNIFTSSYGILLILLVILIPIDLAIILYIRRYRNQS